MDIRFNKMNYYQENVYNPFNNNKSNYPIYKVNQISLNDLNYNQYEFQNIIKKNNTPVQNRYREERGLNYQNMYNNNYYREDYSPQPYKSRLGYLENNNQNNNFEVNNIISKKVKHNVKNPNHFYEDNKSLQQNNLLLKIFIYIYSYEKTLKERNIFINSKEEYSYLINPSWLNDFKKLYLFDKLKKQLDLLNNMLDYNYLEDSDIDYIINMIPKNERPLYQGIPQNSKLKRKDYFDSIISSLPNNKNASFIYQGIIFPKKIMDLINILDGDYKKIATEKKYFFKNNNIYYINNNNIIFGIFNNSALFEPIYAFIYTTFSNKFIEEKKLIQTNINDYIKEKKCDTQTEYQDLMDADIKIGELIVLNQHGRKNIRSAISQKKPLNIKNTNNDNAILKNNYIKHIEAENKNQINNDKINKQIINRNIIPNVNQIKNKVNTPKEIQEKPTIDIVPDALKKKDDGKELLKAFIYIYYYEKSLEEKNIFLNDNKEMYYLINPEWLEKFKIFYSYDDIKRILETNKEINNYNNIDSKIERIIKDISEKIPIKEKTFK